MTVDAPLGEQGVLEEIIAVHTLRLQPKHLGNIPAGVKDVLSSLLLQYSPELRAIPIVYTKADISTAAGAPILFDNPCVHISVRVRWLALVPRAGAKVAGTVASQGPDHLGLLLLSYFNMTVPADQLRSQYSWDGAAWCRRDDSPLEFGDRVECEILSYASEGLVTTIQGSVDRLFVPRVAAAAREPVKDTKPTAKGWSVEPADSKKRRPADPEASPDRKKRKKKAAKTAA